jgi:multidrug efflux pump subunit AcrA (membrane-fusion protein)
MKIKQHLKSLPHQPKKIIVISLILAIIIGIFGYRKINEQSIPPVITNTSITNSDSSPSQNLTLGFLAGGRIKTVNVKAGDKVSKGTILATLDAENTVGALTQAKAAYETAKANYEKIINGATGTTIDVAKAAVNTAKVNLNEVTKQQEILVKNASSALLNSTPAAEVIGNDMGYDAPTVTGTYTCTAEGTYDLKTYSSTSGISINYSGLEQGSFLLTDVSRPLGKCGLFLSFDKTKDLQPGIEYNINIPNKNAPNYNTNYNAYQLAIQTKEQAINTAQATLDQSNASLTALVTTARPEDVATAQAAMDNASGAVQIAQAAYENTIIVAPSDGTVVSVAITPGQIAIQNSSAINFSSTVSPETSN